MNVRLTQIDGKLPNLALMKLAAWYRAKGADLTLTRNVRRGLFESDYDRVYGSSIFTRSQRLIENMKTEWPNAVIGGTGLGGSDSWTTVEQHLGVDEYEEYDYSLYPDYTASIGFTMRGCRLHCAFCVVPQKEGKPRSARTIPEIWRGEPWPKHIVILDNDFFGQPPQQYEARLQEILDGGFKVSFNQGINVRLLRKQEHADALYRIHPWDDGFKRRCLYTAFDNAEDETVFRRGVEKLFQAGFKGDDLLVYMLIGFDHAETWERIFARYEIMRSYNIRIFPMVYQAFGESPPANALSFHDLKDFQRWVIRRHDRKRSFEEYKASTEARRLEWHVEEQQDLFGMTVEEQPQ